MENSATQPRPLNSISKGNLTSNTATNNISSNLSSSIQGAMSSVEMDFKPLAIAGVGFFVGFAFGSGRTDLLSRSGSQILEHTGSLVLRYAMHAFDRARFQPEADLT